MKLVTTFDKIGVAVASGTEAQIPAAAAQPGVTYLEGNTPIEYTLETSNTATRGAEAVATLTGANGKALDGSGVSVAVIDSGVDPHTLLQECRRDERSRRQPQERLPRREHDHHQLRPAGADGSRYRHRFGRRARNTREWHRRRPTDDADRRHAAAGCRARRQPRLDLDRCGAPDRRCRFGAELGARESQRAVWSRRADHNVPADQGDEQLVRDRSEAERSIPNRPPSSCSGLSPPRAW